MNRKLTRKDFLRVGGALGTAGFLGASLSGTARSQTNGAERRRPNVVMIFTDDLDIASTQAMTNTKELLANRGTTFENSIASYPLCGPSRATLLTGQYAHNHGVLANPVNDRGDSYYGLQNDETLPVWLRRAGYETAHIGKYLNGYGNTGLFPDADPTEIPPGWSEWYGSIDESTYLMWGYTLNENGELNTYGQVDDEDPDLYQTDVYARKAADYIDRKASAERPFFLSFAPAAPHRENGLPRELARRRDPRPAPRHLGAFEDARVPRPPSFDEADVSDKPSYVRERPRITSEALANIEKNYRSRLESLLAVDEAVRTIVDALGSAGALDNTLIIFTSDNGFMQGEHRIPTSKFVPYEESVLVPLIMRGPGIPQGERRQAPVSNVLTVPTILEAAGARAGLTLDGISLLPLARGEGNRRTVPRDVLLETGTKKIGGEPYTGIRDARYKYVEYATGKRELYDLERDPYELNSRHDDKGYAKVREELALKLSRLPDCQGETCQA